MSRKGQSLSINTIIVAILAILVLVIVIAIATGRFQAIWSGSRNCKVTHRGSCERNCGPGQNGVPGTDCEDLGYNKGDYVCCIDVFNN